MKSTPIELTYEVSLDEGEPFRLPEELTRCLGQGSWIVTVRPAAESLPVSTRDHSAFLRGYAPEDEGMYDDAPGG
jgi:hypothetical protein